LIAGRFDLDQFEDFAALIVSSKIQRFVDQTTSHDYYDGKIVVCFGTSKASVFRCEAEERPGITLPHDTTLERVPPGRYECLQENGRTRTVTTSTDSVGEGSEKASQFQVRKRNRAIWWCGTSD
jgi:hypothetical protein